MEILVGSHNTDARGANFSHIGGSQIINNNYSGPVYFISLFGSCCASQYLPLSNRSGVIVHSKIPQQSTHQKHHSTDTLIRVAIGLIDQISILQINLTDSLNNNQEFQLLLESLLQMLHLAKCTIKFYEDKLLGQSLTNAINPEVEQCCMLLWELCDEVHNT